MILQKLDSLDRDVSRLLHLEGYQFEKFTDYMKRQEKSVIISVYVFMYE